MKVFMKKGLRGLIIAAVFSILTACGGSGSGGEAVDPATVPLTAAAIQSAQEILDVITDVIDATAALAATAIEDLQTAFDGMIIFLNSATGLTAAQIQSVQQELDDYIGTTDASAGALTAAQIQAAQEALDDARATI